MKNYHDPTPIKVAGKSYIMFRRTDDSNAVFYVRVQHGGKRFLKSTESSQKELAKARAKGIIEAIREERWEDLTAVRGKRSSEEMESELPLTTIKQILDAYHAGEELIRPATAKKNEACLRRILKIAAGKKPLDECTAAVLTEAVVKAFQAKVQGRQSVSYQATMDCNVYANSCYRQAKSIFSRAAMRKYEKLNLPDLDGFMKVPYLKEPSQKYSDSPIPPETIQQINEALPALREFDERLWAIHLMIRLMGLRDSEIVRAQRHWLIQKQVTHATNGVVSRWFLQVLAREGEEAPKRQDGEIPVPAELLPYFEKVKKEGGDFLIPAKSFTERKNLVERTHSQWLRKFLPDRTKTNHELRKHAGSVVATKTNSFEEAARFLRIDIETAKAHYLALLTPMEALGMDDLMM